MSFSARLAGFRPPSEHNPWLDWIRFLAALVVFMTHTRDVLLVEYSLLEPASQNFAVAVFYGLTRLGTEAVIVFFVLSGFLVGGPVYERYKAGTFDVYRYSVDRVVRILVPLYPVIGITVAVSLYLGNDTEILAKTIGHLASVQAAYVPLFRNNVPLWSLAYEVWFYIIAGSLALVLTRANSAAKKAAGLLFLVLSVAVFWHLKIHYLLVWFLGAAAFVFRPSQLRMPHLAAGAVLVVLGVAARQISKSSSFFSIGETGFPAGVAAGELTIGIGMCLVIANLFLIRNRHTAIERLGKFLAAFSFSLYLVHQPILRLWPVQDQTQVTWQIAVQFLLVTVVVLVAAWAYARIFEQNGAKIKAAVFGLGKTDVPDPKKA